MKFDKCKFTMMIFLTTAIFLGMGFPAIAQTTLQSAYFPKAQNGAAVDRPAVRWDSPGSVTAFTRFCLYRRQTAPDPDITGRLTYFITYPPSTYDDLFTELPPAFTGDDYSHLALTGWLDYFGVLGSSCQNNPNASGLTPTTTIARPVPNPKILGFTHNQTTQGIEIGLQIFKPIDYIANGVILYALDQDVLPPANALNVNALLGLTIPAPANAAGQTTQVSFTIGTDPGELNLPVGHTFTFGVVGLVGGNPAAPPIPTIGFTDPAAFSSRLIHTDPNDPVTVTPEPTPAPTPVAPTNLQVTVENVADVRVSWTNAGDYTDLFLYQNDEKIRLDGSAQSHLFTNQPFGLAQSFRLQAANENGASQEVGPVGLDPILPEPPQGLDLDGSTPEMLKVRVTPPPQEELYLEQNQIVGYDLYVDEDGLFDGNEIPHPTQASGVLDIPLPPGNYFVWAVTVTQPDETQAPIVSALYPAPNQAGFSYGLPVTVVPQPPTPKPSLEITQVRGEATLWYAVDFTLIPAQQGSGAFDEVRLYDGHDTWLQNYVLKADNSWHVQMPLDRVGRVTTWGARGYKNGNPSDRQALDFTVDLQAPDLWTWVNDKDAAGQSHTYGVNDPVYKHIHLKIKTNFPAGNFHANLRTVKIWICSGYPEEITSPEEQCPGEYLHDPAAIAGNSGEIRYTFPLPADHSKAGRQLIQVRTSMPQEDMTPVTARDNFSKFSIGVRYGTLYTYRSSNGAWLEQATTLGDINNDDRIDYADLKALSCWLANGNPARDSITGECTGRNWTQSKSPTDRPACLETMNRDKNSPTEGDAYIPLPTFQTGTLNRLGFDLDSLYCDGMGGAENSASEDNLGGTATGEIITATPAPTPWFDQGQHHKPNGYLSAAPVPGTPCYYKRDKNPNRPVFNELASEMLDANGKPKFYPGADAYCRYGAQEIEANARCGTVNSTCTTGGNPGGDSSPQDHTDTYELLKSLRFAMDRGHHDGGVMAKELGPNVGVSNLGEPQGSGGAGTPIPCGPNSATPCFKPKLKEPLAY